MTTEKQAENIYMGIHQQKVNLENTKIYVEIWSELTKQTQFEDKLDAFEEIIISQAKFEWGEDAEVYFNRDAGRVTVINFLKGKFWESKTNT